jgi:hypothetical protein
MPERQEYELGQLQADVGHLKEGQARIEKRLENMYDGIKTVLGSHESRVSLLEGWRASVKGGMWLLGVLWAVLLALWTVFQNIFHPGAR